MSNRQEMPVRAVATIVAIETGTTTIKMTTEIEATTAITTGMTMITNRSKMTTKAGGRTMQEGVAIVSMELIPSHNHHS